MAEGLDVLKRAGIRWRSLFDLASAPITQNARARCHTHTRTHILAGLRLRNVGARRGHSAAAANAAGANDDGLARRLVKAAAAAAVVADAPPTEANAPSAEAGPQTFDWAKAWYPVLAEEHVDPNKPNKVQINGRDVVMWRDGQGAWHAQEDRCPHRLAALSDGFVDVEHNQLVCSYHG